MEAVSTLPTSDTSGPGRKDGSGTEAVINLEPLRKKIDNLIALHDKASIAKGTYNDSVKKVAEQSGLMASVVKRLIAAKASDTVQDKQREAEQLSIVFDDQNETANVTIN